MNLIPRAGMVLVQPDPVATQTDSGLHLVEHWPMEVTGVVVAVGASRHPRKDEAQDAADCVERIAQVLIEHQWEATPAVLNDAAQLLRDLTGREPAVSVGDRVLFGLSAGREVRLDDARYFLMDEADLLAVIPPGTDVAA